MNTCWEGFNVETLEWMLEKLSDFDAKLIRMRYKELKTPIRIANELNLSKEDVNTRLRKSLKELDTYEYQEIFRSGIPKEIELENDQDLEIAE